jgi:hypothetical protein
MPCTYSKNALNNLGDISTGNGNADQQAPTKREHSRLQPEEICLSRQMTTKLNPKSSPQQRQQAQTLGVYQAVSNRREPFPSVLCTLQRKLPRVLVGDATLPPLRVEPRSKEDTPAFALANRKPAPTLQSNGSAPPIGCCQTVSRGCTPARRPCHRRISASRCTSSRKSTRRAVSISSPRLPTPQTQTHVALSAQRARRRRTPTHSPAHPQCKTARRPRRRRCDGACAARKARPTSNRSRCRKTS